MWSKAIPRSPESRWIAAAAGCPWGLRVDQVCGRCALQIPLHCHGAVAGTRRCCRKAIALPRFRPLVAAHGMTTTARLRSTTDRQLERWPHSAQSAGPNGQAIPRFAQLDDLRLDRGIRVNYLAVMGDSDQVISTAMKHHRFAWIRPTSGSYLTQRHPGSGSSLTTNWPTCASPPRLGFVFQQFTCSQL